MLSGLVAMVEGIENGVLPKMQIVLLISGFILKGEIWPREEIDRFLEKRLLQRESPGDAAVIKANTLNTVDQVVKNFISKPSENENGQAEIDKGFTLVHPEIITLQGNITLPALLLIRYDSVMAYAI